MRANISADSAFGIGEAIGVKFADAIGFAVRNATGDLKQYLATPGGAHALREMVRVNTLAYPEVADEYRGIASGAGLPVDDVLTAGLAPELSAFASAEGFRAARPKQCTDYHALRDGADGTPALRAWAHNEDETPDWLNRTYLVRARRSDTREWLHGFAYAPNVVGWAWSFNSHGVAQSINALFPRNQTIGVGVNFLARHVAGARTLQEAVSRACGGGQQGVPRQGGKAAGGAPVRIASGQNFNLGSVHEPDVQYVVETAPAGCDVRRVTAPRAAAATAVAYHANMYRSARFKGTDALTDPSTISRMARCAALPPPNTTRELLRIQSDDDGSGLPIHRTGAPPDFCVTMNTVLFDALAGRVEVWGPAAPVGGGGELRRPLLAYDWRDGRQLRGALA
eukprot:g3904.t1